MRISDGVLEIIDRVSYAMLEAEKSTCGKNLRIVGKPRSTRRRSRMPQESGPMLKAVGFGEERGGESRIGRRFCREG